MKKIQFLKILSLISFLAILMPNEKFEIINGMLLLFSVMSISNPDFVDYLGLMCSLLGILGISIIFFKNKYLSLLGYVFTFIWIFSAIPIDRILKSLTFIITFSIYCLLVLIVISNISKKEKILSQ